MTENSNNWHKVWSSRNVSINNSFSVLQNLIIHDGFDTPLGIMNEEQWLSYIEVVRLRCNINPSDSIFEIGCGSGAFLYPFYIRGHEVGGIDFSEKLITLAKQVMPNRLNEFFCSDASSLKYDKKADVVIANQVIHYFPDMEYVTDTISKMIRKSRKSVCVSGIPDVRLKIESENMRRGLLTKSEYEKKYDGLDIMYFDRKYFLDIAEKHCLKAVISEHTMRGFPQNKFRFDCVLYKN
jgi:2-polyprenyl-3-methyl-5-hydroxy-6-metoxy-1,4-benzoquinol methylase